MLKFKECLKDTGRTILIAAIVTLIVAVASIITSISAALVLAINVLMSTSVLPVVFVTTMIVATIVTLTKRYFENKEEQSVSPAYTISGINW